MSIGVIMMGMNTRSPITAGLLLLAGAGLAILVLFLRGEGLERASWWAAVGSAGLSGAALVVAWLAWKRPSGGVQGEEPLQAPSPVSPVITRPREKVLAFGDGTSGLGRNDGADEVRLVTMDEAGEHAPGRMLNGARDVKIYSRTLVNVLNQHAGQLANIVRNGGKVRILLMEPVLDLGSRLYPAGDGGGETVMYNHANAVAARLRYIRHNVGTNNAGFEVRMTSGLPSFGMLLAKFEEDPVARLIVQLNFLYTKTERDRPLICFESPSQWIRTFEREFDEVWVNGEQWEEPSWIRNSTRVTGSQ
ncbi:hypothetical protein [Micromonospora sp. NPDC005220]|uniref:hypothetical protein n=1 Tax=Micromonospora sp. NPDC005220 TaxID=3155589 RepID=UPI0033AE66B4